MRFVPVEHPFLCPMHMATGRQETDAALQIQISEHPECTQRLSTVTWVHQHRSRSIQIFVGRTVAGRLPGDLETLERGPITDPCTYSSWQAFYSQLAEPVTEPQVRFCKCS